VFKLIINLYIDKNQQIADETYANN